jgi:hypothetical protein
MSPPPHRVRARVEGGRTVSPLTEPEARCGLPEFTVVGAMPPTSPMGSDRFGVQGCLLVHALPEFVNINLRNDFCLTHALFS